MKQTLFIRTILSSLLAVACLALSGNPVLAGINIEFPGAELNDRGDLQPEGSFSDNTVKVLGGKIGGNVYGGYSESGDVVNNAVTITAGSISKYVYGGYSKSGNTKNNTLTISGGTINSSALAGTSNDGTTAGNTLRISGGTIKLGAYGGSSLKGNAEDNTVYISGGDISSGVFGGKAHLGNATGNVVSITNGSITRDIIGGSVSTGNATNNTVSISGGSATGDILGGFSSSGNATGNTVTLKSGATLAETSSIYGGFGTGDAFTDNKLVLDGFHGTVKTIDNFEFIDIKTTGKEEDMIIIAGEEATDLSHVKFTVTFSSMGRVANVGDSVNLIRNDKGIITDQMTFTETNQSKVKGTAYIYDLAFDSDETSIFATVTSKKFNDRSKALAEGRVASMAHLNMGGDLIAEQGMDQAIHAGRASGTPGKKFSLFAAMNATSSKYDTGSHIDLYGYSALAGAAITPPALSSLTAGLFAESGWGHYGSMSEFEDGTVLGAGRSKYYGGGLMTQYDFSKMGVSGLSVDASFRAGKADTSFNSGDLPDSHYDLSAPYYGIHAGVNYTRQLTAKLKMANYARFFWTHLDGDTAPIDNSEFSFRTMDSQRIKAGTRFLYEACSGITPYAGASYEWECSGTARAIVDGANGMAAPSLRGGTGTGELGMIYQPMAESPFWVDLSAQGHVGERQGVSGSVRVRAEF